MIPRGGILTINSGSSSLKLALYEIDSQEKLIFQTTVSRIGEPGSSIQTPKGALEAGLRLMEQRHPDTNVGAISHRIVHGGARYTTPERITPQLVSGLRELIALDPDHLPQALQGIETAAEKYPQLPQIACFDTAFHRTMPRVAQLCPLPAQYFEQGILRYGFHGISYEYIVAELRAVDGGLARGRLVVAHLGNGASMAAIQAGRSVDTSMGFTPASGLLMGTRAGDIDSGVLMHLLTQDGKTAEELNAMINRRSGLLGVSGLSEDMQDLLAQEEANPQAADAIALFCYRAKKYLAAYAGVLGGLDALVFTAGIGEHAPAIRVRICSGLEFLGIQLDADRNRRNAPVISSGASRVQVRVMKTNENLMLARHAMELLRKSSEPERSCQHG